MRAQISRAAFVAKIAAGASGSHVVDATIVSPITYSNGQAGFFTATAQVRIALSHQGTTRTDLLPAAFLWESGRWVLLTLGSGPTPAPS